MANFEFRLQPVLSYKESMVELRQMELAAAQQEFQSARAALEALQDEVAQVTRLICAQQETGTLNLVMLGMRRAYLEDLQRRAAEQERCVAELEAAVARCTDALVSAKQEQETLEKLKERAKAMFERELQQLEGHLIDESATAGFNRREPE